MTEPSTQLNTKDNDVDALRAELANTNRRLAVMEEDAAELRAQIRALTSERDHHSNANIALQEEFDDFKTKVRDVAIRYAERHDWCSVVDEALVSMDLAPREEDITVRIQVIGYIDRTVSASSVGQALEAAEEAVGIRSGERHEIYGESIHILEVTSDLADN